MDADLPDDGDPSIGRGLRRPREDFERLAVVPSDGEAPRRHTALAAVRGIVVLAGADDA
jgi:hypothetical protein